MIKKFKGNGLQLRKSVLIEIGSILSNAKEVFNNRPELAHKYAKKARRITLKYKIKLPLELKRSICKNCHSFLVPGKNLRIRTRKGHIVYYCLECKMFMRIGYK